MAVVDCQEPIIRLYAPGTVKFLSLTTDFELSETCELLSWYLRGCNSLVNGTRNQNDLCHDMFTKWHNTNHFCQQITLNKQLRFQTLSKMTPNVWGSSLVNHLDDNCKGH